MDEIELKTKKDKLAFAVIRRPAVFFLLFQMLVILIL